VIEEEQKLAARNNKLTDGISIDAFSTEVLRASAYKS
jgi:hypothetical protein